MEEKLDEMIVLLKNIDKNLQILVDEKNAVNVMFSVRAPHDSRFIPFSAYSSRK